MNLHGTYKRTSMAHIDELPWRIYTNFHDIWRNILSYTQTAIQSHAYINLQHYVILQIKHSCGEARWSLTRPTTELSSNTLTCSFRNYQTQTEYYTKIPRLYVAQYLRCESEPSAKHYVLSAEKACRLQLYNYL